MQKQMPLYVHEVMPGEIAQKRSERSETPKSAKILAEKNMRLSALRWVNYTPSSRQGEEIRPEEGERRIWTEVPPNSQLPETGDREWSTLTQIPQIGVRVRGPATVCLITVCRLLSVPRPSTAFGAPGLIPSQRSEITGQGPDKMGQKSENLKWNTR